MKDKIISSLAMITMAIILSFFVENIILLVTIWVMFGTSIFFLLLDRDEENTEQN